MLTLYLFIRRENSISPWDIVQAEDLTNLEMGRGGGDYTGGGKEGGETELVQVQSANVMFVSGQGFLSEFNYVFIAFTRSTSYYRSPRSLLCSALC